MNEVAHIERMKAGTWVKATGYRYFMPEPVDRQWMWSDPSVSTLLERASVRLGELNSFARLVPNIDMFIQLHVTKEAVISSRIEGTQTTMDEALLPLEELKEERKNDWVEVNNYVKAMNSSIADLSTLPLSTRMLRKAHGILLQGVRGEHKQPGEFRRSQNWIGGASPSDAVFVPPAHPHVGDMMGDLEKFIHNREVEVPSLIRAALLHYQFETIHPFLDGNGRIGRLLITLYLVSERLLDRPLLYLSSFFERDKMLYYDNLTRVREKNDLLRWVKYFLVGVEQTASEAVDILRRVIAMKAEHEGVIQREFGRRAANALQVHAHLLQNPFVRIKDVQQICDLSPKAAIDLVRLFEQRGILKEKTGGERNLVFIYEPYISQFR